MARQTKSRKRLRAVLPLSHCCRRKKRSRTHTPIYGAKIDEIVAQAQQQGSLNVAISGLNSIRQTLDSLARLAGHLQPASTQVNVNAVTTVNVGVVQIAERLIQAFDHKPELKAQIAQVLMEVSHESVP